MARSKQKRSINASVPNSLLSASPSSSQDAPTQVKEPLQATTSNLLYSSKSALSSLSEDSKIAIDRLRRPKARSRYFLLHKHLPLLHAIMNNQTQNLGPKIFLLGEKALSHLAPFIVPTATAAADHQTSAPVQQETVFDLTAPNEGLRVTLDGLCSGLFDDLQDLCKCTQSSRNIIILNTGAPDVRPNAKTAPFLDDDAPDALVHLISCLIQLEDTSVIIVSAFDPKAKLGQATQEACKELYNEFTKHADFWADRACWVQASPDLMRGYHDKHFELNDAGCEILARLLKPVMENAMSGKGLLNHSSTNGTARPAENGQSRPPLRPAQDVLHRILWDGHFDADTVMVGYEDRHEGIQELAASQWQRDTTDEYWIPMHRIRYFRVLTPDGSELTLWDRKERIDLIFTQ